jgi:BCCIP
MLIEEIQWALEENFLYQFTRFPILSKIYSKVELKLDQKANRLSKSRGSILLKQVSSFTYNPEKEVLKEYAMATTTSSYTKWEAIRRQIQMGRFRRWVLGRGTYYSD